MGSSVTDNVSVACASQLSANCHLTMEVVQRSCSEKHAQFTMIQAVLNSFALQFLFQRARWDSGRNQHEILW